MIIEDECRGLEEADVRNSRAILALNGTLMMILGGSFWFFPEFFTLLMFPDIADNQDAIDVGVVLRKNMGVGSAFIGLMLFPVKPARNQ